MGKERLCCTCFGTCSATAFFSARSELTQTNLRSNILQPRRKIWRRHSRTHPAGTLAIFFRNGFTEKVFRFINIRGLEFRRGIIRGRDQSQTIRRPAKSSILHHADRCTHSLPGKRYNRERLQQCTEPEFYDKFSRTTDLCSSRPRRMDTQSCVPGVRFSPSNYSLEQITPTRLMLRQRSNTKLSHSAYVTLKIFDVLGREVATLVDTKQIPGNYEYPWSGQNFASGIYFYRLIAGDVQLQKKMILLK